MGVHADGLAMKVAEGRIWRPTVSYLVLRSRYCIRWCWDEDLRQQLVELWPDKLPHAMVRWNGGHSLAERQKPITAAEIS